MNALVVAGQFLLAVLAICGIVFLWGVIGMIVWIKKYGRSMPDVPTDDEPTLK